MDMQIPHASMAHLHSPQKGDDDCKKKWVHSNMMRHGFAIHVSPDETSLGRDYCNQALARELLAKRQRTLFWGCVGDQRLAARSLAAEIMGAYGDASRAALRGFAKAELQLS